MAMDWPSEISGWFKSWQVRVTPERSRVCDAAQCNPLTTSPMGLTLWVRCAWFCGPGVTLIEPCPKFPPYLACLLACQQEKPHRGADRYFIFPSLSTAVAALPAEDS